MGVQPVDSHEPLQVYRLGPMLAAVFERELSACHDAFSFAQPLEPGEFFLSTCVEDSLSS
jgi:hypothetical protein